MAQNEDTNSIRQQIIDNRETSQGGTAVDNTDLSARPTGTPATGVKQTAMNMTNEYGEPIYIDGRLNTGAPQKAGAGANERLAMGAYHNPTPEEVPAWAATNEQGQGRLEQMALQMAGENPTLTPEQKEAEQKKRDKKMRWAKLNDAIAAMSNLYFTTQYAPNSFDPNSLATDKLRERYDKIDADRDKDRQAWYNVVMPAIKGDTENQRAYYQLQQQAAEKTKDREQSASQFNANLNFKQQELEWKKEADKANNELKKAALDETARHNKTMEAIARLNASVKGQGSKGEYPYFAVDENGNVVLRYATTQQAQQANIDFYETNYNTQLGSETITNTTQKQKTDKNGVRTGGEETVADKRKVSTKTNGGGTINRDYE